MPDDAAHVAEIESARQMLGWTAFHAWIGYFAVGGNRSPHQIERWLRTEPELPAIEHNMLAQAVNDEFVHRGLDHPVRYKER